MDTVAKTSKNPSTHKCTTHQRIPWWQSGYVRRRISLSHKISPKPQKQQMNNRFSYRLHLLASQYTTQHQDSQNNTPTHF